MIHDILWHVYMHVDMTHVDMTHVDIMHVDIMHVSHDACAPDVSVMLCFLLGSLVSSRHTRSCIGHSSLDPLVLLYCCRRYMSHVYCRSLEHRGTLGEGEDVYIRKLGRALALENIRCV